VSRILLDTSAYSAILRGDMRIARVMQEADEIAINAIVLGELKAGFRKGRHRERNEQELAEFLASPRARVLGLDEETADRYAVILDSLRSAGNPIPTNDVWIAATAMQHGFRILTTDQHFRKIPQIVVDAFGAEGGSSG
jgi:tRNA(fMet)-specific endonuclease VapC